MTPKEHLEHEWYVEEARLSREHLVRMKQLELAQQKLEAQWASWIKIPITIIRLPVYIILAVGATISLARKHEIPENIINLLK